MNDGDGRRTVDASGLYGRGRNQFAMPDAMGAERIDEIEVALGDREDSDVGLGAFAQRAESLRESECTRGIGRCALDDLIERQSQVQELRERRDQVEHRSVHVELMHIARNGSGQQVLLQRLLRDVEGETARAMADIQVHSAGDRRAYGRQDAAVPSRMPPRPPR